MGLPHYAEQEMKLRNMEGAQACLCASPGMPVGLTPLETWPGLPGAGLAPTSTQLTVFLLPQAPLCNGSMVWSVNLTADTVRILGCWEGGG